MPLLIVNPDSNSSHAREATLHRSWRADINAQMSKGFYRDGGYKKYKLLVIAIYIRALDMMVREIRTMATKEKRWRPVERSELQELHVPCFERRF